MVGAIAEKGVEQIAMGAVQFDTVKARLDRPRARIAEVIDDARNLVEVQRTGHRHIDEALTGKESFGVRLDR